MGTPWPQDNFFFQDPNPANLNTLPQPQVSPPPLPLPHHPDDTNNHPPPSIHSHHQPYPNSSPSIPIAVDVGNRAQPPPISVSLAAPLYTTPSPNDAFSQRYVAPAVQPQNNYPFPFSGGAMPPALPPLPLYGVPPRRAPVIPGVHRGGSGGIGKTSSLADIITPNSVRVSPLSLSRQPGNSIHHLPDNDSEDDWQPDTRVGRQRVMTKCPQCGHENHIRRKICLNCQAPKPPPAKRKRRRRRKSTLARQRAAAAAAAAARYELGPPPSSGVTFPSSVSLQPLGGPLSNPPLHTLPPPGSLGPLPEFHRRNP